MGKQSSQVESFPIFWITMLVCLQINFLTIRSIFVFSDSKLFSKIENERIVSSLSKNVIIDPSFNSTSVLIPSFVSSTFSISSPVELGQSKSTPLNRFDSVTNKVYDQYNPTCNKQQSSNWCDRSNPLPIVPTNYCSGGDEIERTGKEDCSQDK